MKSWSQFLLNQRMLIILILGFSSGLPLALVGSTLQAWMTSEHVDLSIIGLFSLVALPYTLKFIWSPLLDRYTLPFLGRRRGWLALTQVGLVVSLIAISFFNPIQDLSTIASLAVIIAFLSASQDTVIDAYRTEILTAEEYGYGSALSITGYRLAMLFSGAFALVLSDQIPWKSVYWVMAGVMSLGLIATLLAKEPVSAGQAPQSLREAVIEPFKEFLSRKGSFEVLSFITVYKLDVVMTLALMTPFILGLGFSRTDIGAVTKGFGLVATLAGTFTGGLWMAKLGIHRSLWIFGILQAISGLTFYALSLLGHHYPMMVLTIACENFFSGMGNSAYSAFLMSLCNPKYTATQYALLSSLMALTRTIAGAPSGHLAQSLGWPNYFLLSIVLAIPGLLLLTRYPKWNK
jgi:PAT family beta-lactamase induction signal transducer AmpG